MPWGRRPQDIAMPRPQSQGRMIVSPTAPLDILALLSVGGGLQALSRKTITPRGADEDGSQSASPSASPRAAPRRAQRPPRLANLDSPKAAPREAWGMDGSALHSARAGHDRREKSDSGSRAGSGRKPKRGDSCPQGRVAAEKMSVEWHATTLFGGDRCTNHKATRAYTATFRRPTSSRAPPHSRPIFVVGSDGQDPKMCVDNNNPSRFTSQERTRYELSWRQAQTSAPATGNRPLTSATIGNIGRPGATRACTPMRPESVASAAGFRSFCGPSPMSGQRPPPARPVSTTPVQRGWSSPPPVPAAWSGA